MSEFNGRSPAVGSAEHHNPEGLAQVEILAKERGVVTVSAIRTYGNLGPFRPVDREGFKGVRLFDILLRPNQLASCSTVLPGDTAANLFGKWGVIIGRGTIEQAFPYDATTSVVKDAVQSKFIPRFEEVELDERIDHAIASRRLHNELNVRLQGIAGLYYCADEGCDDGSDFPAPAFMEVVDPLGIPKYLLRNGLFYPIDSPDDIVNGTPRPQVSPQQITEYSFAPNEAQREEMIDHLAHTLTLAPRNPITAGVLRGHHAFEYRYSRGQNNADDFLAQHARMLSPDVRESLRLYSAVTLYSFGEAALEVGYHEWASQSFELAGQSLAPESYEKYVDRVLPTGNLAVTRGDILHYLQYEALPDYLLDH